MTARSRSGWIRQSDEGRANEVSHGRYCAHIPKSLIRSPGEHYNRVRRRSERNRFGISRLALTVRSEGHIERLMRTRGALEKRNGRRRQVAGAARDYFADFVAVRRQRVQTRALTAAPFR